MSLLTLSRKNKTVLFLSIYIFISLILFSVIFFIVLEFVLVKKTKSELTTFGNNIIRDNIRIKEESIVLINDKSNISLKDKALLSNNSIMVFDKNFTLLKAYGVFTVFHQLRQEEVASIYKMVQKSFTDKKILYQGEITWQGKELSLSYLPLIKDSSIYGVLVIGKNIDFIDRFLESLLITLLSFSFFLFLLSYILSRIVVSNAMKPVHMFIQKISNIHLDNLKERVEVKGSSQDEFVILADSFNRMLSRLEYMAEHQKEFIHNVSHELQTPLAKVIGTLELLENPQNKKNISQAIRNIFLLSHTINDLLLFSKIYVPGQSIKGTSRVSEEIEQMISYFQEELREKNITVIRRIDPRVTFPMPGKFLIILLRNIISNAIKYSSLSSTITISVFTKGKRSYITIEDQGIGIVDNQKIKKRFVREKKARKKASGSGIGLFMVEKICQMYHLSFQMVSKKTKGTIVYLSAER